MPVGALSAKFDFQIFDSIQYFTQECLHKAQLHQRKVNTIHLPHDISLV